MENKQEIWQQLTDYEGIYEISNFGNVKTLANNKEKCEKIMKGTIAKGYVRVTLRKNNIAKICLVHRLVAKQFIPNLEKKEQVNHINGLKSDNKVSNLEWNTSFENMQHASKNNLLNVVKGEKHHSFKLSELKKIEIFSLRNKFTQKEIALISGVSASRISQLFSVINENNKNSFYV